MRRSGDEASRPHNPIQLQLVAFHRNLLNATALGVATGHRAWPNCSGMPSIFSSTYTPPHLDPTPHRPWPGASAGSPPGCYPIRRPLVPPAGQAGGARLDVAHVLHDEDEALFGLGDLLHGRRVLEFHYASLNFHSPPWRSPTPRARRPPTGGRGRPPGSVCMAPPRDSRSRTSAAGRWPSPPDRSWHTQRGPNESYINGRGGVAPP